MSYGVWKLKSRKHDPAQWSAIDLDNGSWGFDLWDRYRTEKPKVYYMLGAQAEKQGWMHESTAWDGTRDKAYRLNDDSLPDDPAFVGWAVYQKRVGRTIYIMPNGGDHEVYFACMPDDFDTVMQDARFQRKVYLHAECDKRDIVCENRNLSRY
jgi:hypothetical protein